MQAWSWPAAALLLALPLAAAATVDLTGGAPADHEGLPPELVRELDRQRDAIAEANQAFLEAETAAREKRDGEVADARQRLLQSLDLAITRATRRGDLDEALALREQKELIEDFDPAPPPASGTSGAPAAGPDAPRALTPEQWELLAVPAVEVPADGEVRVDVVVPDGQRILVVPHPTDTWSCSMSGPPCDYRGDPDWMVGRKPGEPNAFCLIYRTPDGERTAVYREPVLERSGSYAFEADDFGKHDNRGRIRIKLVVQ